MIAPLRHASFRYLVTGRFISMLGNSIAPIALAFAVLDLTGSVRDLGLVVGARSLMNVLFLMIGGVVADRFPRQNVMVISSILAACSQGAVAFLVLEQTATIPLLIGLSAFNGIVSAFAFPAAAALVPQTVPGELIQQANAINRMLVNGAMIVGASVGGILAATVGPGWGLAIDAGTFAIAAAFFGLVRVPAVNGSAKRERSNVIRDLREGWDEFTSHTWLWTVVLGFTVMNAAHAAAIGVLGPVIADESFGRKVWGLVLAAETVGMVAGALIAMRLKVNRLLRLGVICTFGEIPLFIAMAEVPEVALLIPAALIAGIAYEQFGIAWETTMQRYIPAEKLARVYSYDALGSWLAIPLGQVLAGPLALKWGSTNAMLVVVASTIVGAVFMLSIRSVRTLPTSPAVIPEPELISR